METDIKKLKEKITPVANKYGIQSVYLFGSFARGDADANSDYDFFIHKGNLHSFYQLVGLEHDLEKVLERKVDVITNGIKNQRLLNSINRDKVLIYENGQRQ